MLKIISKLSSLNSLSKHLMRFFLHVKDGKKGWRFCQSQSTPYSLHLVSNASKAKHELSISPQMDPFRINFHSFYRRLYSKVNKWLCCEILTHVCLATGDWFYFAVSWMNLLACHAISSTMLPDRKIESFRFCILNRMKEKVWKRNDSSVST